MNLFKRNPENPSAPYYARFQVRGRPYLWSTKTSELFLAKKRAKDYRDAVIAGAYQLADAMKARGIGPTFGELIRHYANHPAPSARTRRDNIAALRRVLAAAGMTDNTPISQLGPQMGLDWQAKAVADGHPPATVNTVLRSARSLFSRHALLRYPASCKPDNGRVRDLFMAPMLREPEKRPEIPSNEAVAAATADLPNHPDAYRAYLLARYAGLRAGEIKAAKKSWIENGVLYVGGREFVAKSRKWRPVALPEPVAAILLAAPTESLVGEFPKQTVNRVLPALLKGYGFPADKPLHSLRRLFGSIVYTEQGPRQARDALGHSTQAVTDRHYARSLDAPAPVAFAG